VSKYSINPQPVEILLSWIKSGDIAIPEIQRPFVWTGSKVRDLIDSLYEGYPVGYIITWRNPDIRLKDGTLSAGKRVLIDGQQRITALTAAVVGQKVLNKDYKRVAIKIAYNPTAIGDEPKFEVSNTAIERNPLWINNIAPILNGELSISKALRAYKELNPNADEDLIEEKLERLKGISNRQIGVIELDAHLDIDTVTEIFIRINQKGVVLSNADFVMSKIASDESYGGNGLRKMIEYFTHLLNDKSFLQTIEANDPQFANSDDFKKISWITNVDDNLYRPNYVDVLRVAYTKEFSRGKFSDLVALLSGRDFENKRNIESIAEKSYASLRKGIEAFLNQTNYQRFITLIQSAGFINQKLISSRNTLNIAYALFLKLRDEKLPDPQIQTLIKRWFVMSMLTGRYSGSSESVIESDSKQILEKGLENYLADIERANLDEGFWNYRIINDLTSSSSINNAYLCYLAAQCKNNDHAFLSDSMSIKSLIEQRGDEHHIFPKKYLERNGLKKSEYNQVANYVYAEQQLNIKLGDKAPNTYMTEVKNDIETYTNALTAISNEQELQRNLAINCVPSELQNYTFENYKEFLTERRSKMAKKIREYYDKL
jgi:hypothetical protein